MEKNILKTLAIQLLDRLKALFFGPQPAAWAGLGPGSWMLPACRFAGLVKNICHGVRTFNHKISSLGVRHRRIEGGNVQYFEHKKFIEEL